MKMFLLVAAILIAFVAAIAPKLAIEFTILLAPVLAIACLPRARRALAVTSVRAMLALQHMFWARGGEVKLFANAVTYAAGTHGEEGLTRAVDAAITARYLLVTKGIGVQTVKLCGTGDVPLGICTDEADAAGDEVNIKPLGRFSTSLVVASEAIVEGANVFVGAAGKVAASGTQLIGVALELATGDDYVFEINDCVPATTTPGIAASTYNANSTVIAVADNTPVVLAFAASTIFARLASGDIVAATVAQIQALLNFTLAPHIIAPVAAAGTTVADAGQLGSAKQVFVTSDGATKGVKFPTGVVGMEITVNNNSATACELYAATGGTINGAAPDASMVIPASKGVRAICTLADTWTAYDLPAKATAS